MQLSEDQEDWLCPAELLPGLPLCDVRSRSTAGQRFKREYLMTR